MSDSRPAPSWRKSTFLHERARLGGPRSLAENSPDRQLAERRAAAWRKLLEGDDSLVQARLESAGLDRESFLALLAAPGAGVPATRESWHDLLQEILEGRHAREPLPPALEARTGDNPDSLPFSAFFQPFLRLGAARLRARQAGRAARHPAEPPPEPNVEAALLAELARRLRQLAGRVLILELNVARMLGRLPGDTPQERFRYFSTTWFEDFQALAGLLEEYPVLARLFATTVERWLEMSDELLERLAEDRACIARAFFGGRDLGALAGVELGLSDLHRGGRGVARLRFTSGARVVYKPKSLGIERWFQQLLQWLNAEGLRCPHRALAVVERDGYGWVEFVQVTGCDSGKALRRFYWRQGSLLALLHLLSATDFHRENLIAAGEHPVLVDLEALFHHRQIFESHGTALERAVELLGKSVLAVGLLPVSVFGRAGRAGIDVSGLGGEAGQVLPHAVAKVEDAGQDTMRLGRGEGRIDEANNRPRLGDELANAAEFTEDIVQGFEETWRLLMSRREALAAVLEQSADIEVRHILRPTRRYATLLSESLHPDFLRDGLERDKVLDHLWTEAADWTALRRTLPFEHADLLLGDVPLFTSRPGQRHLWSSNGTCIPDFFERDSLGEVLERLAGLDEQGCALQMSLIRQAMLFLDKEQRPEPAPPRPRARLPAASPDECLAAAIDIGDTLAAQAIRGREDVCWIGLGMESPTSSRWSLAPMTANLYDGLGGPALFFGYLAAETGRRDFEALARAALAPVREAWNHPAPDDTAVGAFVGRASAAYVLGHLGALWGDPVLLDEVIAQLPAVERLVDADTSLDLIGGVAGCAVVLLGLHRLTGDERLLGAAQRCGERLRATVVCGEDGSARWPGLAGTQPPLAGFSHGAAGIAWALLELSATTGDERLRELACRGLRYERSLFVPEEGNWRDLRVFEGVSASNPGFMVAWCHGAPGIALGRALSLRHLDDPRLQAELQVALATTLRDDTLGNHSLCHGVMGNLEVLHVAGEVLGESRWRQAALERAAGVLREGREGGWRCGLPKNHQTPGLMVGLAGIGFEFLRLAAPQRVPSVLALAAPNGLQIETWRARIPENVSVVPA